ncbi:MAG TPA: glycosyltransferase family 39 protein, partial [Phycisphaerales bacterium]|nr:glycosyltransferase family 39 protein [Phycisphaerales bacterium]
LLIPAYQATGLLMTIDGPYVACWVLACLCAWRWWETDSSAGAIRWSAALGAALGVGFLFKYTILLLIPGLVLFAWAMRRRKEEAPRSRSGFFATAVGVACCTVVFAAVISPVIIWNAREGWPTVAHLLGHVGAAGGDRPDLAAEKWSYDPKWTLELVGSQIGFVGPMLALMGLALRRGFARSADEVFRGAARLGLWAGAPILAFYFVLTFFAEGEANWPIAGYAAMIAPAAVLVARSRPLKNPVRGLWHWSIGYGLATGIGLMLIVPASHLPVVGKYVPLHRFSGWRDTAMKVYEVAEASPADGSESEPFVIARRYDATARLAFYMPGRPSVFCAGPYMGDRKSSYDFFPDTDLHAKELIGRRAVLVGASAEQWAEVFRFERVEAREAGAGRAVYVGVGYGGPAAGGPTK